MPLTRLSAFYPSISLLSKTTMPFQYKHVLMVGATAGIGRAMAERLIQEGSKVTVVGRRKERLDEFVTKYGEKKAQAAPFDISKLDEIPQFAAQYDFLTTILCVLTSHYPY
jgi:NADP-dependent 3-hydroxy acid dehydrogenase YdfG